MEEASKDIQIAVSSHASMTEPPSAEARGSGSVNLAWCLQNQDPSLVTQGGMASIAGVVQRETSQPAAYTIDVSRDLIPSVDTERCRGMDDDAAGRLLPRFDALPVSSVEGEEEGEGVPLIGETAYNDNEGPLSIQAMSMENRGSPSDTEEIRGAPQRDAPPLLTSYNSKKRKRGRIGPDARISPGEESAVSRAIKTANTRPGEAVFYPHVGTRFNSFEEARDFYNLYSWEVGFGIRTARGKKNNNSYITKKDICCSCEGFNRNKSAASCRTGCRASIRLLRMGDHSWYISRTITEHNHMMSGSYGEKKQWNSHGEIDPTTRDFIRRLRENNISTGRVCSILGTTTNGGGLNVRREVVRSVCAKLSQENIRDDLKKTMALLEKMKEQDQGMEVRFKLDKDGRILRMMWCTGKNKQNYVKFGDAVTFDTTYRTNLYNLPFGLFVGVNNHYQSTVFGGVLLTTEKTEDFEWAFSNFVQVMEGKEPLTILTDQCQAMAAAIKTTLKNSRHRWCKWHVLRKAKQYVGSAYSKNGGFKKEFHKLVTEEVSINKFERQWRRLVRKYKLDDNKFLKRIYKKRGMWARPYFMNIFCGGMTSTQRSESANHMLKQFIQRSAPMHLFVAKFDEFQNDRIEQEGKEEHVTKQISRKRRIGVMIERHGEDVYTRAIYERFSKELYFSGGFKITEQDGHGVFTVIHFRELEATAARKFIVKLETDEKITCSCGLYEHVGLLCRHALKVLVHMDKDKIPAGNIMFRWTKAASNSENSSAMPSIDAIQGGNAEVIQKRVLMKRMMEVAGSEGTFNSNSFADAMCALDRLLSMRAQGDHNEQQTDGHAKEWQTALPTACPPRPPRRGRPHNTSLKSYKNEMTAKRAKKPVEKKKLLISSTDEENPSNCKTKQIEELLK